MVREWALPPVGLAIVQNNMKITKQQLKQIIREELAEAESLDLSSLEPQVERIVQNIESEIARLPESAHSVVRQAVASRLSAEDISERKLSEPEKKQKEKVVKGMKKNKNDFKKRYGDDAESVMYATATKIAKEKK